MIIEIHNEIIENALRQHVRDCKNTVTNEYPDINQEVEAILYYFLIGSNSGTRGNADIDT